MITGRADFNKYVSIEFFGVWEKKMDQEMQHLQYSLKEYITISYSGKRKKHREGKSKKEILERKETQRVKRL